MLRGIPSDGSGSRRSLPGIGVSRAGMTPKPRDAEPVSLIRPDPSTAGGADRLAYVIIRMTGRMSTPLVRGNLRSLRTDPNPARYAVPLRIVY